MSEQEQKHERHQDKPTEAKPLKANLPEVATELEEKVDALLTAARELVDHFVGQALTKGEQVIRELLGKK